jgi:hypothetical protein
MSCPSSELAACILLAGGDMFLRNVGWFSPDYMRVIFQTIEPFKEDPHLGKPMFRRRFEPDTSIMKVRIFTVWAILLGPGVYTIASSFSFIMGVYI